MNEPINTWQAILIALAVQLVWFLVGFAIYTYRHRKIIQIKWWIATQKRNQHRSK